MTRGDTPATSAPLDLGGHPRAALFADLVDPSRAETFERPEWQEVGSVSAYLEAIVDHCLAARRLAVDTDDKFLAQLLDAVLFAAACRLAGAEETALTLHRGSNGSLVIKLSNGRGRGEAD